MKVEAVLKRSEEQGQMIESLHNAVRFAYFFACFLQIQCIGCGNSLVVYLPFYYSSSTCERYRYHDLIGGLFFGGGVCF